MGGWVGVKEEARKFRVWEVEGEVQYDGGKRINSNSMYGSKG